MPYLSPSIIRSRFDLLAMFSGCRQSCTLDTLRSVGIRHLRLQAVRKYSCSSFHLERSVRMRVGMVMAYGLFKEG